MGHIFYISGFMASGKSTIGSILANTLGWKFIDLDEAIEKKENKKITQIFTDKGEDYFRQRESEILREITVGDNIIISLGGGTLMKAENREFIMSTGKLIFLKTSPTIAYERLKYKKDRPVLFNNREEQVVQETSIDRIEKPGCQRTKSRRAGAAERRRCKPAGEVVLPPFASAAVTRLAKRINLELGHLRS